MGRQLRLKLDTNYKTQNMSDAGGVSDTRKLLNT